LTLVWQAPGPRTFVKFPYRWRRGLAGLPASDRKEEA
jgi:hypothetical protein